MLKHWLTRRRDAEHRYHAAINRAANSITLGDYRTAANRLALAAGHARTAWPWNPNRAHRTATEALLYAAVGDALTSRRIGITRFTVPVLLSPGFLSDLHVVATPRMWRTAARIEVAACGVLDAIAAADTEADALHLARTDLHEALLPIVGAQVAEALHRLPTPVNDTEQVRQ